MHLKVPQSPFKGQADRQTDRQADGQTADGGDSPRVELRGPLRKRGVARTEVRYMSHYTLKS